MIYSSSNSYLQITEEALARMVKMLDESEHENPVICFYLINDDLTGLALSAHGMTDIEAKEVESIVRSPEFFPDSKVLVETAPRSYFPEDSVVEIGGVPVNAPGFSGGYGAHFLKMKLLDGEFRLEVSDAGWQ